MSKGLLRDNFGIDFSLYKTTTVSRRVQRRLDLLLQMVASGGEDEQGLGQRVDVARRAADHAFGAPRAGVLAVAGHGDAARAAGASGPQRWCRGS